MNDQHGTHEHDHHRMDDDGGPPRCLPRIGIAPAKPEPAPSTGRLVVVGGDDVPIGKSDPNSPKPKLSLVGANGRPIDEAPEDIRVLDHRGEETSSLTWPQYIAWRKTHCRPFNYTLEPQNAFNLALTDHARSRALEEIDQATLEFIGEVAELAEVFLKHGIKAYYPGLGSPPRGKAITPREKLIDECGDILFCAVWLMDAWGQNPLAGADDLELLRVTDENPDAMVAQSIAEDEGQELLGRVDFVSFVAQTTKQILVSAQTKAGLLANSAKKLIYRRNQPQDPEVQIGRVCEVLAMVNRILIMANSSIEEALRVNQAKLNARRPGGYDKDAGA